eukprot:15351543-Ditylum_brightwellii.AAC.1
MNAEDRIMVKAQMNQSWYDVHMKMKRKHKDLGFNKHAPITIDDENNIDSIRRLMSMFDVPELRVRLFGMQQELCVYHTFLDGIEKLKAVNEQLECEAAALLQKKSVHKKRLKKYAYNTVNSLENETVALKMELAQSREKEDFHVTRMRSVLNKKNTLQEEIKALRERTALYTTNEISCLTAQHTTNDGIQARTRGLLQIIDGISCEHNTHTAGCMKEITGNVSFSSPFHKGAACDICNSSESDQMHIQQNKSFTAVSA